MVTADSSRVYPPLQRPLVLYKGTCPFCRALARLIDRLDNKQQLALLPFEDADAAPYLDPFPEDVREESWHLFTPDGRHLTKGPAGVALLESTDRFRPLARVIRTLRLTWLVGALYWVVSKARPQMSRFMSGGPGPRRFP